MYLGLMDIDWFARVYGMAMQGRVCDVTWPDAEEDLDCPFVLLKRRACRGRRGGRCVLTMRRIAAGGDRGGRVGSIEEEQKYGHVQTADSDDNDDSAEARRGRERHR